MGRIGVWRWFEDGEGRIVGLRFETVVGPGISKQGMVAVSFAVAAEGALSNDCEFAKLPA